MAGTLFGLPLSIQFDESGNQAAGGLLYVYDANTSTPANTYADFALASANTWPLELDSVGRIPSFYVDDGSYRARLTTSAGVELFDEQSITAIGASADSGGGSSGSADTETIFQTGDMLFLPVTGTRSGWVRGNGRTIGNGSSGATERANSDTEALFEYFWNNFANGICAVSGGRGASATADFNAGKTIVTLDMRSKGIFGLDTMGNSAASVTGGSSTAADAIGASTYTIVTANLPSTNLSLASLTVTVSSGMFVAAAPTSVAFKLGDDAGDDRLMAPGSSVAQVTSLAAVVGGSIPLGGSGTDMDILPPVRTGTFYFKL